MITLSCEYCDARIKTQAPGLVHSVSMSPRQLRQSGCLLFQCDMFNRDPRVMRVTALRVGRGTTASCRMLMPGKANR